MRRSRSASRWVVCRLQTEGNGDQEVQYHGDHGKERMRGRLHSVPNEIARTKVSCVQFRKYLCG